MNDIHSADWLLVGALIVILLIYIFVMTGGHV